MTVERNGNTPENDRERGTATDLRMTVKKTMSPLKIIMSSRGGRDNDRRGDLGLLDSAGIAALSLAMTL
jgi:hypothetical protein